MSPLSAAASTWCRDLPAMPRAVLGFYAQRLNKPPVELLERILRQVVSDHTGHMLDPVTELPVWLSRFTETPEYPLLRYLAHRAKLPLVGAIETIIERVALQDSTFDQSAYLEFAARQPDASSAKRLLDFYAHKSQLDEVRALRFLIGVVTRHDASFDPSAYERYRQSEPPPLPDHTLVTLQHWSTQRRIPLLELVATCIRRFAEQDQDFRKIDFRHWLRDHHLPGVCPHAGKTALLAQMDRWLDLHSAEHQHAASGGCPFTDMVRRPERDHADLQQIFGMADEAAADSGTADHAATVATVAATFVCQWPQRPKLTAPLPTEGIFAEDRASYPCWVRYSTRFGAGALAVKVHNGEHTLHDLLFLTTTTILNDPVALIAAAGDNDDLAGAELLGQPFYSISPFGWPGAHAVKFRVQPRVGGDPETILPATSREAYRALVAEVTADPTRRPELFAWLLEHAQAPMVLELAIQFATDPDLCPIDDTVVAWPTPFTTIGTLHISPAQAAHQQPPSADALRFNPSDVSSAEHLPLGRLNRIRRDVYRHVVRNQTLILPYCVPVNQRVAVVGGGVSGLSAALALAEHGYQVTVYEKNRDWGGHACTRSVFGGRHMREPAFGAFRRRQWPNTWAIMSLIGAEPISHGHALDWFDSPFAGWFDRDGHPVHPSPEVLQEGQQFVAELLRALDDPSADERTVGSLIEDLDLSEAFVCTFFLGGVIHYFAGQPLQAYLDYPLRLVAWMWLNNGDREPGETIELFHCHNADYIQKFTAFLETKRVTLVSGAEVSCVQRGEGGVSLRTADTPDTEKRYGHLVLAIQPHQALRVLGEHATPAERRVLEGFEFTRDVVVVHEERGWLPDDPSLWKLFNVCVPRPGEPWPAPHETVPITIQMPCARDGRTPVLATYDYAHASEHPSGDRFMFEHTVVNPKTQRLRQQLSPLQGALHVQFCGSWSRGLTLHEDAIVTGLEAANRVMGAGRSYPVLQPPVPLPQPLEARPQAQPARQGLGDTPDAVLAALQDIFSVIGDDVPSDLSHSTQIRALGLSSLHFARLANALNTRLEANSELDILTLLQLETVGDLVQRLLTPHHDAADATTTAPPDESTATARRDVVARLPRPDSDTRWSPLQVGVWQLGWTLILSLVLAACAGCAWYVGTLAAHRGGWLGLGLGLPLGWSAFCATLTAAAWAVKRGVLGTLQPGSYPVFGSTHMRFWSADLFLQPVQQLVCAPLQHGDLPRRLLQQLGAEIAEDVTLSIGGRTSAVSLIDADLITIEPGAYIRRGASIHGHYFMDGRLVIAPVHIGSHASLAMRAIVEPGARLEQGAALEPHTVLTMGTTIPEGTAAQGVPAQPLRRASAAPPPPTAGCRHWGTLLGLGAYPLLWGLLLAMVATCLAPFAGGDEWPPLDGRTTLALWPAVVLSTAILALAIAGVKAGLLRSLQPGTDEASLSLQLTTVRWLTDWLTPWTWLWPTDLRWLWARLMGAKIHYRAVRDTPFVDLTYAHLLRLDEGCFWSVAAAVDFVVLHDGAAVAQPVHVMTRGYVGAYATVVGPAVIPEQTLIASASSPPHGTQLTPGEVWVGAPARPVTVDQAPLNKAAFAVTGPALLLERFVDWAGPWLFYSAVAGTAGWLSSCLMQPASAGLPWLFAIWQQGVAVYGAALFTTAASVALLGRGLRRAYPLETDDSHAGLSRGTWTFAVWQLMSGQLVVYALLQDLSSGTRWQLSLARWMGAEIGDDVVLDRGVALRELAFTRLDDGVMLNRGAALIAHSEQPDGRLTLKPVHLHAGSSMGFASYIVGGTKLPSGVILGSLSRPFDGQHLEPEREYNNTPCR